MGGYTDLKNRSPFKNAFKPGLLNLGSFTNNKFLYKNNHYLPLKLLFWSLSYLKIKIETR